MSLAEHVLLKEYDMIVGAWSRYTRAKAAMVVAAIGVILVGILAKLSGGYPAELAPVALLGMLLLLHFINYLDLRTTTLKCCLAHTEERLAALAPELSADDAFFRYYNRLNRRNLVLQLTKYFYYVCGPLLYLYLVFDYLRFARARGWPQPLQHPGIMLPLLIGAAALLFLLRRRSYLLIKEGDAKLDTVVDTIPAPPPVPAHGLKLHQKTSTS